MAKRVPIGWRRANTAKEIDSCSPMVSQSKARGRKALKALAVFAAWMVIYFSIISAGATKLTGGIQGSQGDVSLWIFAFVLCPVFLLLSGALHLALGTWAFLLGAVVFATALTIWQI